MHNTISILRKLYTDFPSQDPTVRLVLLLTVFLSKHLERNTPSALKAKFVTLGLTPLSRKDIFNVLVNPFIEKYNPVIEFAKTEVKMLPQELRELVEEVAIRCLEVGCKGKMLKRLVEDFPMLKNTITKVVLERYQLNLEDLPRWEEDEEACKAFSARLCRDYDPPRSPDEGHAGGDGMRMDEDGDAVMEDESEGHAEGEEDGEDEHDGLDQLSNNGETPPDTPELVCHFKYLSCSFTQSSGIWILQGNISQDTLSVMIRQEEATNRYSRRRPYYGYNFMDMSGKMTYPEGQCFYTLVPKLVWWLMEIMVRFTAGGQMDQGTIQAA